MAGETFRVKPVDLLLTRGWRLRQDGQPLGANIDPARRCAAGRDPAMVLIQRPRDGALLVSEEANPAPE
jgi:hypothetical protein